MDDLKALGLMLFNVLAGGYLATLALSPIVILTWAQGNLLFAFSVMVFFDTNKKMDILLMATNRAVWVLAIALVACINYIFL